MAPTTDSPAADRSASLHDGSWDGLVVLCATNSWDSVKLGAKHMAEHLTAHAPVLYVDPPISPLSRFKNPAARTVSWRPRVQVITPRLARYTPVVLPKPTHTAVVDMTSWMLRRQLRSAVRELGASVHAVVAMDVMFDVYGACGEKRRVYWWRDDPVAGAAYWGIRPSRLRRAEERLVRSSDLLVAVNELAVSRWRKWGVRAVHLPNGCDADFLADVDARQPASDVHLDGPVAGFIGHINSRTDLALLEAVADAGVSLLLVGPKDPAFEPERFNRLVARDGVVWVGERPFDDLPSYLRLIDVGLVPYRQSDFNRYSFPLKTLEYLAAGRAVVATPLPALKWLQTDLVALASTPEAFATTVVEQVALARDPVLIARRRELGAQHSWAERAERFAALLELPVNSAQ